LASIDSSKLRTSVLKAARAAAEAFAAALLAWLLWPLHRRSVAVGLGTAWLVSSLSTAALLVARETSVKAFWWAFGGGMTLRLGTLIGLMAWSAFQPGLSQAGLLLAYAFGVLGFLLLEYRYIRLK
jgi:hypothetical protein